MNRNNFPVYAAVLGAVFLVITTIGSRIDGTGATLMPLFTLLAMCEFGFLVNAGGAFLGAKRLRDDGFAMRTAGLTAACILMALIFFSRGLTLWPN